MGLNELIKTGVEVLTLLLALLWHANSSKRRQESMHEENRRDIVEMKAKLELVVSWMKSQLFGRKQDG